MTARLFKFRWQGSVSYISGTLSGASGTISDLNDVKRLSFKEIIFEMFLGDFFVRKVFGEVLQKLYSYRIKS